MSVINETLDNLKQSQAKKQGKSTLNPASSTYNEKIITTASIPFFKKSYMIPVSFAILVGSLFYITQMFVTPASKSFERANKSPQTHSWFSINLQKHAKSVLNSAKLSRNAEIIQNPEAKNMYYNAMALLNEGKEQQALQRLKKIIAQYPEFAPAQKAYGTLASQ